MQSFHIVDTYGSSRSLPAVAQAVSERMKSELAELKAHYAPEDNDSLTAAEDGVQGWVKKQGSDEFKE